MDEHIKLFAQENYRLNMWTNLNVSKFHSLNSNISNQINILEIENEINSTSIGHNLIFDFQKFD